MSISQVSPEDMAEIKNAVQSILPLNLAVEVCGNWVWVSGDTKPHKDALKAAGFKWAPKKANWFFKPSSCKKYFRGTTPMDEIRVKHGVIKVRAK
jgi:hypothetical protein